MVKNDFEFESIPKMKPALIQLRFLNNKLEQAFTVFVPAVLRRPLFFLPRNSKLEPD
jgi:hypothetical protein